jgi:putative SOS response-associated peptidase YedK
MPVILPEKEEKLWLESDDKEELQSIMKPYPEELDLYPVSRLVNSPRNNTSEIIKPAEGFSGSLF